MKKKKLLIVVDYQNDFTVGSLGCPQAAAIEDTVAAKIEEYRAMGENAQIIFTMDTHDKDYLHTQAEICRLNTVSKASTDGSFTAKSQY